MNPKEWLEQIVYNPDIISPERIALLLEEGEAAAEARDALFAHAARVRSETSGDKIFLYGFVYFSTRCRNNCNFCYYRRDNNIERYRKSPDEIIETAERLVESGISLVDLTMGEDPEYGNDDFSVLISLVREVKARTGAPIMISFGVLPLRTVRELAEAGADFFALYQETHNRDLFAKLRIDQDYDERMNCKLEAKAAGMHIEEGVLTGVGETPEDIYDSLMAMGRIGADQMRAMSFVPQPGSPMEGRTKGDRKIELVFIALLRIIYPHALIPATLDVDGMAGLAPRIRAGANVVTSIIPPHSGYRGVAQSDLDIDTGARTVAEARAMLKELGLRTATMDEYRSYLSGI